MNDRCQQIQLSMRTRCFTGPRPRENVFSMADFFFFFKLLSEVNRNQRRRASLQKGAQSLIHTLILKLYVRSREVN